MTKKIILGAMDSDAPGDIITLLGYVTNVEYETLQTERGSAGAASTEYYQVPSGYELVIVLLYVIGTLAEAGVVVGYGDDAVAKGASAPTNAVGLNSSTSLLVETAKVIERIPVCFIIPEGKYPYILGIGTVDVIAFGFLHRT